MCEELVLQCVKGQRDAVCGCVRVKIFFFPM